MKVNPPTTRIKHPGSKLLTIPPLISKEFASNALSPELSRLKGPPGQHFPMSSSWIKSFKTLKQRNFICCWFAAASHAVLPVYERDGFSFCTYCNLSRGSERPSGKTVWTRFNTHLTHFNTTHLPKEPVNFKAKGAFMIAVSITNTTNKKINLSRNVIKLFFRHWPIWP